MAQFTVNAQRFDPYKNFKFRVKWDGRYVAGVSKVGALKRTTEVVEHREGGDPSTSRKSPGRTKYEAITLERGVTHDPEFEKWANKVWNFGSGLGAEVSLKDFRKDLIIEVYNEAGQLALAYKVYRCWVSEFQALPDLDANANAVAIQHIKLENEGWERDYEVAEPSRAAASPSRPRVRPCAARRRRRCSRCGSGARRAIRSTAARCSRPAARGEVGAGASRGPAARRESTTRAAAHARATFGGRIRGACAIASTAGSASSSSFDVDDLLTARSHAAPDAAAAAVSRLRPRAIRDLAAVARRARCRACRARSCSHVAC